jgi:hypothetical protein
VAGAVPRTSAAFTCASSFTTAASRPSAASSRRPRAGSSGAAFDVFIGAGFKSWTVFAVVLVVVLMLCLLGGHYRVAGRWG